MKNKYSYLNSKYQTSDTYSVFFKSKLNIRESTEVAIHPGTRGATVPLPWYESKRRGGTSPSQRLALLLPSTPEGLLQGLPAPPHSFTFLRHPRGATTPSSPPGSRSSTGGFHSTSASPLTFTLHGLSRKSRVVNINKCSKTARRHCPFTQGLSPPAPLHRRSSVFIKVPQSPKCCTDLSRQFKVEWVKTLFPSNESLRDGAEVECEKCKGFSQDLLDTHL